MAELISNKIILKESYSEIFNHVRRHEEGGAETRELHIRVFCIDFFLNLYVVHPFFVVTIFMNRRCKSTPSGILIYFTAYRK